MKQECFPVGCVPPTHWTSGVCVPYYLSHHAFDVGGCLPRGYLPRGVSACGCLPGGAMWPIPSCIWCWGCLPRGCLPGVSTGGVCAMWPNPSCIWCWGCLPRGCMPRGSAQGVYAQGVCSGGCLPRGCLPGRCLPRGCHVTYPIMHLMLPVCCPNTNWMSTPMQLLI